MDLSNFTLFDLHTLVRQVNAAIEQRRSMEIARARAHIIMLARQAGMSLKDLREIGKAAKVMHLTDRRSKVAAKYCHPRLDLKWTGRGRTPV